MDTTELDERALFHQKVAWVFSPHGGQWSGMGQRLYERESVFRQIIAECDREIQLMLGWSLLEEFTKRQGYRLHVVDSMIQPALTALQIALSDLLRSLGIEPSAVTGLSMGEAAGAYTAGILNLHDAMKIVCCQAKLTAHELRPGKMVVVNLSQAAVEEMSSEYGDRVAVGVELSPSWTVLSGEATTIDSVLAELSRRRIACRLVHIGFAFHSPEVSALEAEFLTGLRGLCPRPLSHPFYSSVTGRVELGSALDAGYWWRIMSQRALFGSAIRSLLEDGFETFVEIGPHPMMTESIQESAHAQGRAVLVLPSMMRGKDEVSVLKSTFERLVNLNSSS